MHVFLFHNHRIGGSPPRVRGHADAHLASLAHDGITPAGAGTWCGDFGEDARAGDHPRGCGDMSK